MWKRIVTFALTLAIIDCAQALGQPATGPATTASRPTSQGDAVASPAASAAAQALAPARPIDLSGPPESWLPTEGKSDAWIAATTKCRELLSKLKLDDVAVKKHLPTIKDKVTIIRRQVGFDWKGILSVQYLQGVLEDLADGKIPNQRYAGKGFGYPYWSEATGRMAATWVQVPADYDPAKRCPMFLLYKNGGGIHFSEGKAAGGYRPEVEMCRKFDCFFAWSTINIQAKGRMGVEVELAEFPDAFARDFAFDRDRLFLSGWSDGGFTSVWLGSRWPDLVTGIAPDCGNWQYANVENVGLLNIPQLVLDGWFDGGYNTLNIPRLHILSNLGGDEAGIIGQHGHSYAPYETEEEMKQIVAWAHSKTRDLHPKRVRYATWLLDWHKAYWFSIERMIEPALAAQFDAKIETGNTISVQSWNIAQYKLTLDDKLVDPAKPIKVLTNGKESYAGAFQKELTLDVVKLPAGKFAKTPASPGDITGAVIAGTYHFSSGTAPLMGKQWLQVEPTGGDDKTMAVLAKWWTAGAKADADITDQDIAAWNLFIFGGPEINKFAARIAGDLPVKFEKGKFTLGKRVYDRPTNALKLIHPNPLNPLRYVILYAFNDAAEFAKNGFFDTKNESAWRFRSGDVEVLGVPRTLRPYCVEGDGARLLTQHFVLDSNWRAPDETPIGELTKAFDYNQIQRLRADAMREATGCDAALVSSYVPGWNRWGSHLPAGPVTVHDLATIDMFPQYVLTCQATGSHLLRSASGAVASTVSAHKVDPACGTPGMLSAEQVKPEAAYKVAGDAYAAGGPFAYGVNPSKMPPLFAFTGAAGFTTADSQFAVKDLVQTPVEITQAVADYIRKRGKVAPRPTCADFNEYLMNPVDNFYSGYDWLHLTARSIWKTPSGVALDRPYTFALALKPADGPEVAEPKDNSKAFDKLDLSGQTPLAFDFATLGKKLPVKASAKVVISGIVPEGESFKLAGVADAKAIAQVALVRIQLANGGQADLAGLAVLTPQAMREINMGSWPARPARGATQPAIMPYYYGLIDPIWHRDPRPAQQQAALFVGEKDMPPAVPVSVPYGGFNFGLIGLKLPITLKARVTATVPMMFISFDQAKVAKTDLIAVLEAVKTALRLEAGSTP